MQIDIKKLVKFSSLFLALSMIFMACSSSGSVDDAVKSVTGEWKIKEIYSAYGQQVNLGLSIDFDTTEVVTDGTFNFNSNGIASYYYNRLDTLYAAGELDWSLTKESQDCGFTPCDLYLLSLDTRTYECQFGDETSDAHIDATEIRLISETRQMGPYRQIIFFLEKN